MVTTIYALSSGRPPAGIAIVRVSGPRALDALVAIAGNPVPPPRALVLRTLRGPDGGVIDRALVVAFASAASATGEDLVEFHLHGGIAVVAAMLQALAALPGFVMAAPGEFTRRAFDNGRLDLAQVEGLADLIDATTEAARKQALAQAGGHLGTTVARWRSMLIEALADVEARLDFADAEDDVADRLTPHTSDRLHTLRAEMNAALADVARSERLRDGLIVAITGAPNVGKSSLINALAKRDAAIVSEHAGTTRDAIEVHLDLAGVAVTVIDTAGLRDTTDPIEREGIRRGRQRAGVADLVLSLGTPGFSVDCNVVNKIDVLEMQSGWHDGQLHVSALRGDGIEDLRHWLSDWASSTVRPDEPSLVGRERHRAALAEALDELDAMSGLDDLVLIADRLRRAALALASCVGAIGTDTILDAIFSRFCIGK